MSRSVNLGSQYSKKNIHKINQSSTKINIRPIKKDLITTEQDLKEKEELKQYKAKKLKEKEIAKIEKIKKRNKSSSKSKIISRHSTPMKSNKSSTIIHPVLAI